MRELQKEELKQIYGGAISATLFNAFVRGVNTFLEVGRSLGSAVRRIFSKNVCPIS